MQIVSGIGLPLADEHVLSTDPNLAPLLPDVWLRRMNAFPGRSVSADALTAEQEARAGRIRLRGQSVSAGVVRGLGVTLEAGSTAGGQAMLQVAAGFGLARSGEDIAVATPRRLRLADIPVYARADWLDAAAPGAPPSGAVVPQAGGGTPGGAFADLTAALPRRMAASFGSLIGSAVDALLPRVAILVAEPVTAELVGRNDPADLCPQDPRDDPYDDWQRIDGCRLALYLWPSEVVAVAGTSAPDYSLPPPGPALRSELAWRVFHVETGMLPDEMHPWEALGVPLALIGFKQDWSPLFADRSAVLRLGGLPKLRTAAVRRCGSPSLWQARLSQFVEQLGDLDFSGPLSNTFRELPPVGLLPASALDTRIRQQKVFPGGFAVSAVPIAAEQLDLALGPSAALAPFNLNVAEPVELLVPVPERVYEPGLLRTETVDPLFAITVAGFTSDRTMWLVRREMVRRRRDVLSGAISGTLPSWRATDPDETATERLATPTQRPPVSAARFRRVVAKTDLRAQRFAGADVRLPVSAGDELFVWVRIVTGAAAPTGLSLGVAPHVASAAPDFGRAVYWGKRTALPQFAADTPAEQRLAGPLPPRGTWTRLSAPAAAIWATDGSGLGGLTLDGVAFTQAGGTVEWGPFGKRDLAGNETVWIADEAQAGASLQAGADAAAIQWIDADPADEIPVEDDFGTARIGDSRVSGALEDFRGRWTMPFLSEDFVALDEGGLDGLIGALGARLLVTNDALDLGFARARTDIYRVRQYVLGADAASRLVTSPTLADIAVREDSARANSEQIREFVAAAYVTPPARDPANPMQPIPPPPVGTPAPALAPAPQPLVRTLSTTAALRTQLLTHVALATVAARPVATPVPSQPAAVLAATPPTATSVKMMPVSDLESVRAIRATEVPSHVADVQEQLPLTGYAERSASVGERLTEPPALEAYRYAIDGKQSVLNSLIQLIRTTTSPDPAGRSGRPGIGMADLQIVGFALKQGVATAGRTPVTLGDYLAHPTDYEDADELTGDASKRHESDYFTAAVAAVDNAIAMMRLAEGRVALCTQMLADARNVRADIAARIGETDPRLRSIEAHLAQARNDLAAASALLTEEQSRVAALNARRTAVLQQYVRYLAYRRPRTVAHAITAPISPADSAVAEDTVAVCTRSHPFVPEELRTMAGLFREAPIRWLPPIWPHLSLLDTADAVLKTADTVQRRAPTALPFLQQAIVVVPAGGSTRYLAEATTVLGAHHTSLVESRTAAVQFDRAAFAQVGITAGQARLIDLASPADLLDGAHGRVELIRRTSAELERIAQVAACLYASFSEVLPAMRIGWAEALVGLTGPVNLQSLTALPHWSDLTSGERREQQGLVDYLFSRTNPADPAAASATNDLVRVALLMACHAPVDQIVGAAVAKAAPAKPGGLLHLAVDPSQVRVGMSVLVRDDAGAVLAHGVVEDVAGGTGRARIAHTVDPAITITTAARVHLSHALPPPV